VTALRDLFVAQAETREGPLRERIEAITRTYLASFAADDLDARLALFAPDAAFEDPVGTAAMIGHDALRAFYGSVGTMPTNARLLRLSVNGNEAAMLFEVTIFGGDAGDATVSVIETMEVGEDGLIRRLRAYWDRNSIT